MAPNRKHIRIPEKERDFIISSIENGVMYREVAKQLNRSVGSISSVWNSHNRKIKEQADDLFNLEKYSRSLITI